MRASWTRTFAVLVLAAACDVASIDLPGPPEPPPPPPEPRPGTVYGRIVVARPGTSARQPAPGALVAIAGTSLEAVANAEGRFIVEGVLAEGGTMLVRYDAGGDGDFEKQRTVELAPFNVGYDRQIDLGDLVLNDNARVSGRVRLATRLTDPGGHGGVTVFVPEGPFVTVSADDGTWSLADVPEGPTRIALLRPGFGTAGFDGLQLRGGEELVLREVVLEADEGAPQPGAVSGTIQLVDPTGTPTVAATVTALSVTDEEVVGASDALGAFVLRDLDPGVYSIAISQPGFTTAVVPNVAVLSALEVRLSAPVVLVRKPPAPPPCPAGQACKAADPCRDAAIVCIEGRAVCVDAAVPRPAGTACGEDAVCNPEGACQRCDEGEECGDPEACASSRIACATGRPECVPTGESKAPGASCGSGRVCDADGACNECSAGLRCDAGSDCVEARTDCSLGFSRCVATGALADAGTPCGIGTFCNTSGECVACDQNRSCSPGDPCRVGAISCATGEARCLDLGFLLPAGTACEEGRVCSPSGACVSCDEDVSCVPPNRCRLGAISCATGAPRCIDTAATVAPGTSCGQDRVCDTDGTCVSCTAGAPCVHADDPCAVGTIACDTGAPVCVTAAERRPPGSSCGEGRVCDPQGRCEACASDLACTPDAECRVGRTSCASGTSACVATSGFVTPGTGCGEGRVCSAGGACVDCAAGTTCQPSDPCAEGVVDCSSGAPFCVATGAKDPGTACDEGKVCNAAGQCLPCVDGARCTGSNPCVESESDCSTGESRCVATSTPVPDGTTCGDGQVCHAGGCDACAAGTDCTAPDPCKVGRIACGTGVAVCEQQADDRPLGTPCGPNRVCNTGACVASGLSVTIGAGQSVLPGRTLTQVRLSLADGAGVPKPNVRIDVTPPPGVFVTPLFANTDGTGHAYFAIRAPTRLGAFTVPAVAADGARTDFVATVVDAEPGTILPVMNATGAPTTAGDGGPATVARADAPRGFDVAADGTIYFADYLAHVVRRISAQGVITRVAGTLNAGGFQGDGGPAVSARLSNPVDVALSADESKLYVSDYNNSRVREIDLASGGIRTVVGGGTQGQPGYGDNGPGLDAQARPTHITRGPDGGIYFTDLTAGRIRRYDAVSGLVTRWLATGAACSSAPVVLNSINTVEAGQLTFDAAGNAYVTGNVCGSSLWSYGESGVVRRAPDGTLTHVAGAPSSGQALAGIPARDAYFSHGVNVAVDRAGQVFIFEYAQDRIRVAESATGRLRIASGAGGSYLGDFGPYAAAGLDEPQHPMFVGDDLYFADTGNDAIRRIRNVGTSVAPRVTLSVDAGSGQTVPVGGATVTPLTALLTDAATQPLPGSTLQFRAVDEGAGVYAASAVTGLTGRSGVNARVGLLPGTYRFEATFSDTNGAPALGAPLLFQVNAVAPAPGTIFGAVNAGGIIGNTSSPIASTLATGRSLRGIATLDDGTMFVADYGSHCVYKVTPAGLLSVVAGRCGTAGFGGDFGPGPAAFLSQPWGLAVSNDEATLYIADHANHRVRAVDLASGNIVTFAGGSVSTTPPYGDGGRADAAYVPNPRFLGVGPDDSVYVASMSIYRIRRIDPAGTISTVVEPQTHCGNANFGVGNCVSNDSTGCSFVVEPDGSLLVQFAAACGTSQFGEFYASNAPAIVRWNPDRTYTRYAGRYAPATPEGTHVSSWSFAASTAAGTYYLPVLARDGTGALLFVQNRGDVVRRVNPVTGNVERVAGGNGNGFTGNGGPATASRLNAPWDAAPLPGGHLAIVDGENNTVRIVW